MQLVKNLGLSEPNSALLILLNNHNNLFSALPLLNPSLKRSGSKSATLGGITLQL